MPTTLKELFVVLFIAFAVFKITMPVVLIFCDSQDFARRRRVWLGLTTVAFISPSFWIYVLVAIPVLLNAGRKDSNPSALYILLLHVIPPLVFPVPMIGMPFLFILNNYLLLAFCVMAPAALEMRRRSNASGIRGLVGLDYILIAYGTLTAILYLHTENPAGGTFPATATDCLRRAFVFFFGTFIPYFVISRSASGSRRALVDDLVMYCLAGVLMATMAVFETAKHWLLYGDLPNQWGLASNISMYVTRGTSLRAMAASGHPLALGFLLAIGFGLWMYLQSRIPIWRQRVAGTALIWSGLLSAYSRGPWIGALSGYMLYILLTPRVASNLARTAAATAVLTVGVAMSPLWDKITAVLPFFGGKVDSGNIEYRRRLVQRAWELISVSPWLGDQDALPKMHDLRQGQGIIDMVNTYLTVLLDNGFIGLFLFLGCICLPTFRVWTVSRRNMLSNPDFGKLGASLVACTGVTLLLLGDGSFATGAEITYYILCAASLGYSYLGRSSQRESWT